MANRKIRSGSPAEILMRGGRQHHAEGGIANMPPQNSDLECRKPDNTSGQYKRGGRTRRYAGGPLGLPQDMNPPMRQQATPLRRGGRARHREHHFLGALVGMLPQIAGAVLPGLLGNLFGGGNKATGGEVKNQLRQGGRARRAAGGPLMGSDPRTWSPYPLQQGTPAGTTPLRRGGRARSR